ncbi:amino acid ABC transporter membrane protein 1 (PAAT family) [Kineothrix alysoides]|uniref:Amino acid ABC transporter membrane protein 1 (PAAT family) n=1 Tax=Kineothrix alysoides TaxID=1469948 RepID=A0A4R1R3L5_9FIRM|nr:amino acid ABC transporter permease [Kineothrix alysoides]TCL60015.1 amino acid ABC transporter membrane protein 1 (PAAT family) [Kineothrix alysoides]
MLRFNTEIFWESFPQLLRYLPITFEMIFLSLLLGVILSLALVVMKLGKRKALRKFSNGYTTVIRCTPSIVLLFLVYYGLPKVVARFGVNIDEWNKLFFVVLTYALMSAGGLSEVMRSSYEAIPRGQTEAALSAGLTRLQTLRRIVLPQAFVVALPNLGNTVISILKNGALAYTIGFADMMGKATRIIAKRYTTYALETYVALAIIYWVICILIEQIIKFGEQRLEKRKIKAAKEGIG